MTESLAFALEQPHGAVVCVGHHDHAVTGRGGDGLTAGGHTAWHTAPGPVMTADVSVAVCLWKCSWDIWNVILMMFPDLVVLAAVDSHGPAVLHLGPDVEALHAAIDNLRHNTGGEAGGQGVAPLAVRTTSRSVNQTD